MNKTNSSLRWWLLYLICSRAGGPKQGGTPPWLALRFCKGWRKWEHCCISHRNSLIGVARSPVNCYQNDPTCRELTKHWLGIPWRDRTIKYGGGTQIRPLELYIFVINAETGLFPPKPSIFFTFTLIALKQWVILEAHSHRATVFQHCSTPSSCCMKGAAVVQLETTQSLYSEWTH